MRNRTAFLKVNEVKAFMIGSLIKTLDRGLINHIMN